MSELNMPLHSEVLDKITEALANAQKIFKVAFKDKINNFTKSKYASYESMRDACKEGLGNNGLAIIHQTNLIDGKRFTVTTVLHTSGQWLRTYVNVPMKAEDAHSVGGAMTYGMRYGLTSLLAIPSGDEDPNAQDNDDDGNAAQGLVNLTLDQVQEINLLIGDAVSLRTRILKGYGKEALTQIPASEFEPMKKRIIALLKASLAKETE